MNRRKDGLSCEIGMSSLGLLFFAAIVFCVGWLAYNIIPFYYNYYELEGQMAAQANKASLFTDKQITDELFRHIKKLGIPIEDRDELKINRFGDKVVIELEYDEVLSIDLSEFGLGDDRIYDLWVFHFHPRVEK